MYFAMKVARKGGVLGGLPTFRALGKSTHPRGSFIPSRHYLDQYILPRFLCVKLVLLPTCFLKDQAMPELQSIPMALSGACEDTAPTSSCEIATRNFNNRLLEHAECFSNFCGESAIDGQTNE
jgi:hypothetical protein